MTFKDLFGKELETERRKIIIELLKAERGLGYISRYRLAHEIYFVLASSAMKYDQPDFPIEKEDFYKSHAARVITADIAAIIHSGAGVKLQGREDAETWLKAQFKETLGKLNHLKDIARKNGLDGQVIMSSPDVISAYID